MPEGRLMELLMFFGVYTLGRSLPGATGNRFWQDEMILMYDFSREIVWHIFALLLGLEKGEYVYVIIWYGLTLIPAWISNHMLNKMYDQINDP